MKQKIGILFVFWLLCSVATPGIFAQTEAEAEKILKEIESGIATGNVELIEKYLSEQSFISLRNGISGFYSANQSYYMLQDFFTLHKPQSFVSKYRVTTKSPYSTGEFVFYYRLKRERAQVYLSLIPYRGGWRLSQLSIQ